jgi:hypothetical protein
MNITIIVIAGILALGLVVFLVFKNIKDEQKFEEDVKHSYPIKMNENNDNVSNELEEGVH